MRESDTYFCLGSRRIYPYSVISSGSLTRVRNLLVMVFLTGLTLGLGPRHLLAQLTRVPETAMSPCDSVPPLAKADFLYPGGASAYRVQSSHPGINHHEICSQTVEPLLNSEIAEVFAREEPFLSKPTRSSDDSLQDQGAGLPVPSLVLDNLPFREGVSTITAHVTNLPQVPTPSDPSANPPVAGNLPSVVVLISNPGIPAGEWSRADLVQGGTATAVQTQEVKKDGSVALQLKTAPIAGQKIRILLYPPQGQFFVAADNSRVDSVEFSTDSDEQTVYTSLVMTPLLVSTKAVADLASLSGTATPSISSGPTVNLGIVDDSAISGNPMVQACYTVDQLPSISDRLFPLNVASGTSAVFAPTNTSGGFTLTPATPLQEGQRFHLVQIYPAHSLTAQQMQACQSNISEVQGALDWGRVHADFTAGILLSNDSTNAQTGSTTAGSGNFSQAHQFYALNVEKVWALPSCYIRLPAGSNSSVSPAKDLCYDKRSRQFYPARRMQHLSFGVNSYFQARLTAIPVSAVATDTTSTTSGTSSSTTSMLPPLAGGKDTSTSSSSQAAPSNNLISTARTAQVQVGVYFPFFITRWEFQHQPNALFVAPLAKTGFNTVTGPSAVNSIITSGDTTSVQSQTFEQVYNYWGYGMRVGHMQLTRSASRAPETYSYLDITIGPYSNLQTYICHSATNGTGAAVTNSACSTYATGYPDLASGALDSRKRIYRLDFEGLLKIPQTPLYVGFNANIGQRSLGAARIDPAFAAPDDVRIFFGTKFDIASVLNKFKLGPQ
jgi:hypothetical protein